MARLLLIGASCALAALVTVSPVNAQVATRTSANELVSEAAGALANAQSVHVVYESGSVLATGKAGPASFQLDALLFRNGDLSGSTKFDGFAGSLIVVGRTAYEKSTAGFYEHIGLSASVAESLANFWIAGPNSSSSSSANTHFTIGTNLSIDYLDEVLGEITGPWSQVGTAKTAGVATDKLRASSGATLWVRASTPHLFTDLYVQSGETWNNVYLPAWNEGQVPRAPAPTRPASAI